jgi:hypothetical protein
VTILVGEGGTKVGVVISGEGETVGGLVGVEVGIEVGGVSVVWMGVGVGRVELSALTGLTLNCNIGQRISTEINSNNEEDVNITPLENLA